MTISMKDSQQHDSRPANGYRTDTLLAKGPMGEISVCSAGCLHVDTPSVSVLLTESDFLRLVSMFSNAATTLTILRTRAVPDQVQ